jgi:polyribonucleotide nucleotidyltransferase
LSGYTPLPVKAKKKKSSGGSFGSGFITDALDNAFGGIGGVLSSSNPNDIAVAIERQAANQQNQADQKAMTLGGTAIDPFSALQQQLFSQANSIDVAPTPLEQLQKLAQQQVSAQYDPQISALGDAMQIHTRRAGKSSHEARDMYGSLAQDYLSQLPDITAHTKLRIRRQMRSTTRRSSKCRAITRRILTPRTHS